MGQQQLLLVILVTIIVGIATVVAINTFGSAADSANLDAVRQDVASIGASSQGYFMKPDALGGGGNKFTSIDFTNVAFGGTITSTKTIAYNSNGTYSLTGNASNMTITAYPSSDPGYTEGTATGGKMVYTVYRDSLAQTTAYTPGGTATN